MYLVHDKHLAQQAQQPQRLVPALQCGQQSLIDRSNARLSEQGALVVVGQPAGAAGVAVSSCWRVSDSAAPGTSTEAANTSTSVLRPCASTSTAFHQPA
jgi:hypothetical protein